MASFMFLHNSRLLTPVLHHHISRLALQTCLVPRTCLPVSIAVQNPSVTPTIQIDNSIRSLRTSAVNRRASKELIHDEHEHDHAKLWIIEKSTNALLALIIPAALIYPNRVLDSIMAILICAHSYWGLEACIVEYARTIVVGYVVPYILQAILFVLTVMQLGGLFFLAFNGYGISKAFWEFWLGFGRRKLPPCPPPCPPTKPSS